MWKGLGCGQRAPLPNDHWLMIVNAPNDYFSLFVAGDFIYKHV